VNTGRGPAAVPIIIISNLQLPAARRSLMQCRIMALDIVKLYISIVSEFFLLSDKPSLLLRSPPISHRCFPKKSNALTTAYPSKPVKQYPIALHVMSARLRQ
jgi:hypothetical protein